MIVNTIRRYRSMELAAMQTMSECRRNPTRANNKAEVPDLELWNSSSHLAMPNIESCSFVKGRLYDVVTPQESNMNAKRSQRLHAPSESLCSLRTCDRYKLRMPDASAEIVERCATSAIADEELTAKLRCASANAGGALTAKPSML